MNTDSLLTAENLSISFKTDGGRLTAVEGISFSVRKGELLGIVGESGCGKSVTSLAVMGLIERPGEYSADRIMFDGMDISKISCDEMRKLRGREMSMIFQEPLTSLNPLFTVGNQISEMFLTHESMSKRAAKDKSVDMLRKVGIPGAKNVYNNYPNSLSGGMRQRVMIAMALSLRPKLLIADEPTTALDVTIQAQILELMKKLMEEYNTAIMFITHDLGVVAEMADRVIVMYAGQIVEEADVYELFANPVHPYTKGLLKSTIKVHELKDKLESIEGTVPSLSNMPKGCRFRPRCKFAQAACREGTVALTEVSSGHKVRCSLCGTEGGLFL